MLAIELANPFPFSLLNIQCVTGVDFFQDGNGEVSDVVITLAEVLTSCLADVTILNVSDVLLDSCPKFPFCFSYILHLATSLVTCHNIYNPGRTAVNWSIYMNNYSSN